MKPLTFHNDIFRLHAEVCKTLSHAKRLKILSILRNREMSVGAIVKRMNIPKANVSQHLAVLRKAGIVETRRDGVTIYYRIPNSKVIKACDLMRQVLIEQASKRHALLQHRS